LKEDYKIVKNHATAPLIINALMIKNMTAPAPPAPPKIIKHFGDPAQKFRDYIFYSTSLACFSNFRASIAIYYEEGSKFSLTVLTFSLI
jgi:hypothetical protein